MTTDDHDPIVARALRDMPVPEHLPGFWDALDQRLAEESGEDDASEVLAPSPEDIRVSTAELPAVIDLRPPPQRQPSPNRYRFLAVAAAVAVLAITAGVILRGDGNGEQQATPTTPTAPVQQGSTFDAPPQGGDPQLDTSTPEAVVDTWLRALDAQDWATAAALVGPTTTEYITGNGSTMENFLAGYAEGYGPWTALDTADFTITTLTVPDAGDVVVVHGIYPGVGTQPLERIDAFPTVEIAAGQWVVEPVAHPGDRDPTFGLVTPQRTSVLRPDSPFEARSEAASTYWFSLDGSPPEEQPTGRWVPTTPMAAGHHTMVVVAVGQNHFAAYATTFDVAS